MSTNEETFVVGADGLDTDREQESDNTLAIDMM